MHQSNGDDSADFDTVYMVGDNPASDIRGANRMGAPWESVLVLTGKSSRNDKSRNAREKECHGSCGHGFDGTWPWDSGISYYFSYTPAVH